MPLYLPIAEISLDLLLLVVMGLGVGVLAGLFGIGGGFILTPALIFLGVPSGVAVGTGAAQVVASSVSGAVGHWQRKNVDTRLGLLLIAGGLVGAFGGIQLQQSLKAMGQLELFTSAMYVIMLGVVGALMLIESARFMRAQVSPPQVGGHVRRRTGGQHSALQHLPFKMRFRASKIYASAIPPVGIGAFVGLLTAIMGVGGGFVLIPALIYLIKLPTRMAMGTSSFQIIFITSVTTVLQSMQNHAVDLMLALPLMAGGVVGAQWGVRLGAKLKAEQLRFLLGLLVVAVAVRMAHDLVTVPADLFNLDISR
jgi:uncharacterized protein